MGAVWLAFLTGLTTGGLTCVAVQGGLLATSITSGDGGNQDDKRKWGKVSIFLLSKLVAYTILGFLLGSFGSIFTLAPRVMGTIQIIVGLFMLATAARLVELHPIFRYFVIQPTRWAYRVLKQQSRDTSLFGPALLGLCTVLMPCGVTQATMAVAVASGNPTLGAAIMFAFVLGTSPIFFALGASVTELIKHRGLSYIAAIVVVVIAIVSINGGFALRGSIYTIQNFYRAATTSITDAPVASGSIAALSPDGYQEVSITVSERGYTASADTLKVGIPVRVKLATNRTRGCARAFAVPDYGISKVLPETGEEIVEFTPDKIGRLAYACSMGMYNGSFIVIN